MGNEHRSAGSIIYGNYKKRPRLGMIWLAWVIQRCQVLTKDPLLPETFMLILKLSGTSAGVHFLSSTSRKGSYFCISFWLIPTGRKSFASRKLYVCFSDSHKRMQTWGWDHPQCLHTLQYTEHYFGFVDESISFQSLFRWHHITDKHSVHYMRSERIKA